MATTKPSQVKKEEAPSWAELREMFAETDKKFQETARRIKEVSQQIGGISESNGEFAEDYFYNVFNQDKTLGNIHFDNVERNLAFKGIQGENDEYDIVMLNDKSVAIIETKYKARDKDLDQIIRKADTFRYWQPQYKKHKIYLGLASLNLRGKALEDKARKHGIAVIRQRGGKLVVNDENLRAY